MQYDTRQYSILYLYISCFSTSRELYGIINIGGRYITSLIHIVVAKWMLKIRVLGNLKFFENRPLPPWLQPNLMHGPCCIKLPSNSFFSIFQFPSIPKNQIPICKYHHYFTKEYIPSSSTTWPSDGSYNTHILFI